MRIDFARGGEARLCTRQYSYTIMLLGTDAEKRLFVHCTGSGTLGDFALGFILDDRLVSILQVLVKS